MPDEIVTIRIDFEANRRDMARVLAELEGFEEAADGASDASDRFTRTTNRMNRTVRQADEPMAAMRKRFTDLEQSGRRFGKQMTAGNKIMGLFKKTARLLFFHLIALVAEFVITAATLASVNLMFKLGQWAVKGYNLALGAAGAALATVAVAASTAVAAFKEFNAAAAAWQYKGANIYGSATGAAAAAMRGLYSDTNLATMGVTNLTQAYKTMSQQGRVTGAQTKALSGAMDFTARSQDQAKSFQAMANFVAILQKEGKVTGAASTAASGVSKEFAEAIKKSKGKDAQSIMAAMSSGKLAQQAGVSGEFGSIKGTLVAQFKQITVALAQDMADFGEQFLNDTRKVLDGLYKNVRNVFARLAPEFTFFGKNKLFPAITTIGNALERFSVTLVRKYLPMLFGASEWFKKTSASFMKSFNQFKNSLEKFREGSRIITEMFKGPIFAIFRVFARNAESLGYLAQDNEEQFKAWGGALENLIFAIGDWFAALKVAFTEALPVLTQIMNVLSKLIGGMASLVRGIGTFKLGGGEGFLGMGGSGGGPSGTVGGGLGPGIGYLVTLGLAFGGFKGSRTAYRMRRGGGGSVGDLMNSASKHGAQNAPRSMFGGIPAMFSRKRYSGDRGNMRLTPAEVAANTAYSQMMMNSGRSYHDPGALRDMGEVKGAEMMGLGRDKTAFARNGFERIGFGTVGDFRNYMSGPVLGTTIAGQRMTNAVTAAERAVMADPRFASYNAAKQEKLLNAARDEVAAQQMRTANQGRDLMYGRGSIREFFFGGNINATTDGAGSVSAQREGIFKTLSGKRMKAQIEAAQTANNMMMGGASPGGAPPSALAVAREKSLKEFMERDRKGLRKFVDSEGRGPASGSKLERQMYRAFAREQFKGRTGAMFKGLGESAQASMRKSFNPMMGMMGGMLLSTGITNKIGDQDMRSAANNALGVGAMFGARGMGIAAGLTLMKSTSTGKSAMGGALAGAAVGKTIVDTLGPVLGPAGPLAKAAIIGGSAVIGGIVGAMRAQGNREREAKKVGAGIGQRLVGMASMAMAGGKINPRTGRYEGGGRRSFQAASSVIRKQREMINSLDLGGYRRDYEMFGTVGGNARGIDDSYMADRQLAIMNTLRDQGLVTKSEYKKFQQYQKQARGFSGDENAVRSMNATISGFQENVMGYMMIGGEKVRLNRSRSAEEFMRGGGKGDMTAIGGRRGSLVMTQDEAAGLGRQEVQDIYAKRAQSVVNTLTRMTGKTEDEILRLASKMDVDLGDPMKGLTTTIGKLGLVTRKTIEEMRTAIRDLQINSLNVFDEEIQKRQTTSAFTASYNNLKGMGSSATIDNFRDYARTMTAALQADNPNNPFVVLSAMKDFSEGNFGPFGAMSPELRSAFAKDGQAQAKTAYGQQLSGMATLSSQQMIGGMVEQGKMFKNLGANAKLEGLFREIYADDSFTDAEKNNLMNFLATGQMLDATGNVNYERISSVGDAGKALTAKMQEASRLSRVGGREDVFATETTKIYQMEGDVTITGEALKYLKEIAAAYSVGFDDKPEGWEKEAPQWWSDMKKYQWKAANNTLQLVEVSGDTRTSRMGRIGDTSTSRALRGTMAAHARFNSLLTGKRTVTSALRFDNLGSMSSDHAAGRAYDLTGDNLGQYQQMISKSGGFAEFHGWGSSRHLHVVPPIGGTNTPRSSLASGVAGTMNQNVTLNVYGAPGQSETAIARQVVMALEQQQRAYRERT